MCDRTFLALYSAFILMISMFISASDAGASSVRKVLFEEMVQQAEFVFEGKVLALEAAEVRPRRIYTYVTFEILEILKGEYPKGSISLRFLGGTVGNESMAVSDMQFPKVGEHGIYFVASLERLQVHPLYGWSQGHFVVRRDKTGIERVMTNRERPIMAVSNDTFEVEPTLSSGVARGLVVSQERGKAKGVTTQEFKNILQQQLGNANVKVP